MRKEFERVTPESVGISSQAVLDLLDELSRRGVEMHSIALLRHGKICAEGWWKPYEPQTPHIMFSFSKSLTSTAIGFAVQEGILSLNDRIIDFFPDKLPENVSENLKKAEIRHLLMMGCGHETEIPRALEGTRDWIAEFLAHPFVYEPGTHFLYNTAGTNMLCAILKRKTGLQLTEYLKPRLFEPLGMSDVYCRKLPDGTEMGGAGCYLTTDDMIRFIQFVANWGKWEGKQLLEESWFDQASAKQISTAEDPSQVNPDWRQGYCFQYWRCQEEGVFRADGAYGQYGFIFTKQDMVLIVTSAILDAQNTLSSIWDKLMPGVHDGPLPEDRTAQHILSHRLKTLELAPMHGMRNPEAEKSLDGAVYLPDAPTLSMTGLIGGAGTFQEASGELRELRLVFKGNEAALHCVEDDGEYELKVGMEGHFVSTPACGTVFGLNGSWRAADKWEIHARNVRAASGKRMIFRFEGSKLILSMDSTIPQAGGLSDPVMKDVVFTLKEGDVNLKTKMYWEK